MSFLSYLLALLLSGLIVGALARFALPGRDPMSIPTTIAIGIAGSFAAGLIVALLGLPYDYGWFVGLGCATVIVYFVRRSRGGGLTDPGVPPGLDR
jgi:uncharacterized membrane protein YeaQ/YmgE (transglycosylase-associated protein family)